MAHQFDINAELRQLVDRWCDLIPLRIPLPAWPMNMRLTDEWADLLAALRHLRAMCRDHLPKDEYDIVNRAVAETSRVVHRE